MVYFLVGNNFLEKLDTSSFETLPPEFANLQKLKHLVIRNAKWEEIPASIYELRELTHLSIGKNLAKLSDKIGNLKALRRI